MAKDIEALRAAIRKIDSKLVRLFCERMAVARHIGQYKLNNGIKVIDRAQEEKVIERILAEPHEEIEDRVLEDFFKLIMLLSREEQFKLVEKEDIDI